MESGNVTVGVRYCGGCNPRYDRVAVVKRLQPFFPAVSFVPAQSGIRYAAVLLVHGCPSRCAGVSDLPVTAERLIQIGGWEDLLPAKERLCRALEEPEAQSMDRSRVLELLPHRDPILLIDEVNHLIPGTELTASFAVRPDLPVFQGHFPGDPVFPGTYAIEAGAQAAGLLLLSLDCYKGKTPLLVEVQKALFRRRISPGDLLDIHASLKEERREAQAASCRVRIFTGGKLSVDLELTLALR